MPDMAQTRSELAAAITHLARQILTLCQDVTTNRKTPGAAERTKTEAQELADSGKCLNCGKPYPKDDQIRRGLDSGCYSQIKRLVDRGEYEDGELVAAGVWLSKLKGGRPKAAEREGSAMERYAESRRVANEAALPLTEDQHLAADMFSGENMKAATPKAAKPLKKKRRPKSPS